MKREDILRYLSEKKPEFENEFGVKKIGLFGSYAREKNQDQSDVDIVRYRDRMNRSLKKQIDKDAVYA